MLYWLLVPLRQYWFFFNVFRWITVRTALAGITALFLSLLFGPMLIKLLKKYEIGQEIRLEGPQSHYSKKGTPSMGGILIIGATIVPTLLWGNLENSYVWLGLGTMFFFGLVGFLDDYLKIKKKRSLGLIVRKKLVYQFFLAAVFALIVLYLGFSKGPESGFDLRLYLPFFKKFIPYLGWFYGLWIIFIMVSSSNAVNLADGLDGLAIGLTLISAAALTALTYIAGHAGFSDFLKIASVKQAAELTVFAGALTGACLGFLWFNSHPAQVFMGDVGALTLGGLIATLAVLLKQEFLFVISGGIFVLEAASVLIQEKIGINRLGRRLFYRAPLHHSFQYMGMAESKVTVRFWIVSIILMILALGSIKIR